MFPLASKDKKKCKVSKESNKDDTEERGKKGGGGDFANRIMALGYV
jgi:hypothetical protein